MVLVVVRSVRAGEVGVVHHFVERHVVVLGDVGPVPAMEIGEEQ